MQPTKNGSQIVAATKFNYILLATYLLLGGMFVEKFGGSEQTNVFA